MWFEQKAGIPSQFCIDGKVRSVKRTDSSKPFATVGGTALYLLSTRAAEHLFLDDSSMVYQSIHSTDGTSDTPVSCQRVSVGEPPSREITLGVAKVAEEPVDADFEQAATYTIELPADSSLYTPQGALLRIDYRGDVARLYADGHLIADNFYNGRPFLFGLWRLPSGVRRLELRLLPIQQEMPVYFPREADTSIGQQVKSVTLQIPSAK